MNKGQVLAFMSKNGNLRLAANFSHCFNAAAV